MEESFLWPHYDYQSSQWLEPQARQDKKGCQKQAFTLQEKSCLLEV